VRHAADDHDTTLRCGHDAVEQTIREQKMAQMIDDELHLDAIDLLQLVQEHAGVQDQHVDRRLERANLLGTSHNRIEVRELEHDGSGPAFDADARFAASLDRARRADDMGAA
jgi:hypothetical protein